ncbi:hypothetical protein Gotur_001843 [Gossypium turneri]
MKIIRGYLMPDLSRNLIHLRWLLKLIDFRAAGEFSWGSAVLTTLYREMCGATRSNKVKIGELAYVPKYMPWFRILGKPYLLSEEERRRQLRVQRE